MANSNGFVTPTMSAMAEPGSNRALTASLPSPATIPSPGSSKIGGSRPSLTPKTSKVQNVTTRALPGSKVLAPQFNAPVPLDKNKKQQRTNAIKQYHQRLMAGHAEAPAAFLQSISHLM